MLQKIGVTSWPGTRHSRLHRVQHMDALLQEKREAVKGVALSGQFGRQADSHVADHMPAVRRGQKGHGICQLVTGLRAISHRARVAAVWNGVLDEGVRTVLWGGRERTVRMRRRTVTWSGQ